MGKPRTLLYLENDCQYWPKYKGSIQSKLKRRRLKVIFTINLLLLLTCHLSLAQWNGFRNITHYPCTQNYYVLIKDVNNDNFPDIITANTFTRNSSSFDISINDGTGHFHRQIEIPIRSGYTVWDFADLDGDGYTDILTSYYWDNGIRIYQGNSYESFTEGPLVPTATHGWISKISDIDDDGNLDLVSISHGSGNPIRLHVFKGTGGGTFLPKLSYDSKFTTARYMNIKDINQDGLPDVVLAGSFNKIPVFVQNKDHTFSSDEIPVEHGECFDNALGDINNDGITDIVYGSGNFIPEGSTDTIRIALGKGNGVFKPSYTSSELLSIVNPIHLRLADLNQDRNLDIITFDFQTSHIFYFLGNGDGTFDAAVKIETNDTINKFEVNDVNQDSFPDIVTVNKSSSFSILLNNGKTTDVEDKSHNSMLKVFPNPFKDFANVELSIPEHANVKMDILDVYGRKKYELMNGKLESQFYKTIWHSDASPGIYFLSTVVDGKQIVLKMIKY
jgi:hypothetical protein